VFTSDEPARWLRTALGLPDEHRPSPRAGECPRAPGALGRQAGRARPMRSGCARGRSRSGGLTGVGRSPVRAHNARPLALRESSAP